MPEADGFVRIKTDFDDASLVKKLASVNERINRQTLSLEKAKEKAAALAAELEKVSAKGYTSKAAQKMETDLAEEAKRAGELKAQLEEAQKARDALLDGARRRAAFGFNSDVDKELLAEAERSVSNLEQKLQDSVDHANELAAKLKEAKLHPEMSDEARELSQKLGLADLEVQRLEADLDNSRAVMQTLQTPAEKVSDALKKTGRAAAGLSGYFKRLARQVLIFQVARQLFSSIRQSIAAMSGLSVVTNVFSDFNSKMREAYANNESVQASLAKLRGAMYSAFAPIYNTVVPALVSLINWLARAISYIAAFFAALKGQTLNDSAAGAKNLAKAVGGVGGAAKQANKQLATFDKLNTLSENTGGGGGGGIGAAADEAVDFDINLDEKKLTLFENIGKRVAEIVQKIKDNFAALAEWWDTASPEAKAVALIVLLGTLIPLLWAVLGWPAALIVALVALFVVVEKYYGQITGWLDSAYNTVHNFFKNASEELAEHLQTTKKWLHDHLGFLGDILGLILDVVGNALLAVYHVVQLVVETIINVVRAVVETVHAIATGDWKKAWEAWSKVFKDIWDGIKRIVFDVVNAILGGIEAFLNMAVSGINHLLKGLASVASFLGIGGTFQLGYVSLPRIPQMAEGGFPDVGSLFIAGEAGPELVGSFGGNNNSVINEAQLVAAFREAQSGQLALLEQQNALLAAILDKEFTIKPSSAAGRVFSQSIGLYNRAMGV